MKICTHDLGDFIYEHPVCDVCPSDEEIGQEREWFMRFIEYRKNHPKRPGEEGYEFWKHYQEDL